ncbi:circadian clock KaiB family protein [Nocardioides sp. CFH 31398]|uniref:circadian clock KaiB family protein n=1 Tax=Nocardioides sp. CFH 31398 TaxID=2919579 RepID=UPI001F066344|nr:circadian clock KaiB family protein [Nocardioides sp. CFH 31398]MCH1866898.1 circadian clock KaiB family protein [Nocardioides sp. CFH 31398]
MTTSPVAADLADASFHLRLYVAGQTPRSALAQANLYALCEARLPGRHHIEIVDLMDEPARARTDGVIAVPTLIRVSPTPVRRVVGDLSDTARLLAGLELGPLATEGAAS